MFEAVIGIEVHVELSTASKIFCGCSTQFGAKPNSQVCPVCLGLPGALPSLNKQAVEFALKAALALNCRIKLATKFDRKHYFYTDLPKGYQISQFDQPLGRDGYLDVEIGEETRRIRIRRVHLEEDTGKVIQGQGQSFIDYNRSGVPLLEIVTEPDLRTPEEAKAYVQALRSLLEYLEISDCRVEEGSMRCEANISLKARGSSDLGTLNEIKNIGSFSGVQQALAYEIKRQSELLSANKVIQRQTLRWNEEKQRTEAMRDKEEAKDYRYITEPDLAPLQLDPQVVESCRNALPELPQAKIKRYIHTLGLTPYDAKELVKQRELAQYFDAVVSLGAPPKATANWLLTEMRRILKQRELPLVKARLQPEGFAELISLVTSGEISAHTAKEALEYLVQTGGSPQQYVRDNNLAQLTNKDEIASLVELALANNPQAVLDYKSGKDKALGALVGYVIKQSQGKASPNIVYELLQKRIKRP